jgi:hypothetical protein
MATEPASQSNTAMAQRIQEKFDAYLLGLIFTILGLSIQTAKLGDGWSKWIFRKCHSAERVAQARAAIASPRPHEWTATLLGQWLRGSTGPATSLRRLLSTAPRSRPDLIQ